MSLSDERPRPPRSRPAALLRELRARGLLLPLGVGLAVVATLAQGLIARAPTVEADPPDAATAPDVPSIVTPQAASAEVLQTLRPGLEKTPLSYLADYWLQLGAVARPKLVRLGSAGLPGIVVVRGLVLAPLEAAEPQLEERRARIAAGGDPAPADSSPLIGVDAELGVALFRLSAGEASVAFSAAGRGGLAPGTLLAAVSLAPGGGLRVIPGYLASTQPLRDTSAGDLDAALALPPGLPLAAVVDLDGGLVGVAVADAAGGRPRLWSYEAIAHVVARLVSDPTCRSLEVAALAPELARRLGVEAGVIVERVRSQAWGASAPIRAGDVLLEWNGEAVVGPQQFDALYAATPPGAEVGFRVSRDRRRSQGTGRMPGPGCRPVGEPLRELPALGVALEWEPLPSGDPGAVASAWRVRRVAAASPAAAAGVEPGDWILAVDGRRLNRRSLAPLRGIEPQAEASLLTLQRGERVLLRLARVPDPPTG